MFALSLSMDKLIYIMTLSLMTFGITTLLFMTLKFMTLNNDIRHYDTQINGTRHYDTQNNDIQHTNVTPSKMTLSIVYSAVLLCVIYAECHLYCLSFMLSVIYTEFYKKTHYAEFHYVHCH